MAVDRSDHPDWAMPMRPPSPYGRDETIARPSGGRMNTRRCRVQAFDVAQDGSIELPEGAIIISLVFESEGAYGYHSRPVSAWAEVPADA
jgi:hypothetical protein